MKHNLVEYNLSEINSTWQNELDMVMGYTEVFDMELRKFPCEKENFDNMESRSAGKSSWRREQLFDSPEINNSINEYREITNETPFTLIGFDACLMGFR